MNKFIAIFGLAVLAVSSSCSKTSAPASDGLYINLPSAAIAAANIDSADVVFRRSGSNTIVRERFYKTQMGLVASMKALAPGNWSADIMIFTKLVHRTGNQYVMIRPLEVTDQTKRVGVEGPGATSGNGWSTRHVIVSAGNEVMLIVPDDPTDPYFEFRTSGKGKYTYGIHRQSIHINYLVGDKNWVCNNSCVGEDGHFTDVTHFAPFVQSLMNSPWTTSYITISVLNDKLQPLLEYDRTWTK